MKNLNTKEFWDKDFKNEYKNFLKGKGFVRWFPERFESVSNFIKPCSSILDYSCGLGHFCRFLKAKYPLCSTHGVDISEFAIEKAREISSGLYSVTSYNRVDIDEYFDVAVAMEVIEHTDKPEEMVTNLLKRADKIILTTPIRGRLSKELTSPEHVFEFNLVEFREFLSRFGEGKVYDMGEYQLGICSKIK